MDALPVAVSACSIQAGSSKAPSSAIPAAGKLASVSSNVFCSRPDKMKKGTCSTRSLFSLLQA
ncbi:MAG TPA: hypothetical protein VLA61_02180, partial [Ideonella sp.]|uniref:hypothetical protein n=1 Tax=Ideonella sp. TaxID=1929293 RepID=UPI002C146D08